MVNGTASQLNQTIVSSTRRDSFRSIRAHTIWLKLGVQIGQLLGRAVKLGSSSTNEPESLDYIILVL